MISLLLVAACLILLLGASEIMVRELTVIGEVLELPSALLGLIVAAGADAPEISTAVAAMVAGSQGIGLGVVEGSNLYNLAGLLGLIALVAGALLPARGRVVHDGLANLAMTVPAVLLVLASSVRSLLAVLTLLTFLVYFGTVARHPHAVWHWRRLARPLIVALLATVGIVALSTLLVQAAIGLIHQLHVSEGLVAILVLPVSTSLPNTWAALSLARRGMGDAVVATTFLSNDINVVFGIAAPSLVLPLHPGRVVQYVDGPYLLAMTVVTLALLYAGNRFSRRDGAVVIAMYVAYLVARLSIVR